MEAYLPVMEKQNTGGIGSTAGLPSSGGKEAMTLVFRQGFRLAVGRARNAKSGRVIEPFGAVVHIPHSSTLLFSKQRSGSPADFTCG